MHRILNPMVFLTAIFVLTGSLVITLMLSLGSTQFVCSNGTVVDAVAKCPTFEFPSPPPAPEIPAEPAACNCPTLDDLLADQGLIASPVEEGSDETTTITKYMDEDLKGSVEGNPYIERFNEKISSYEFTFHFPGRPMDEFNYFVRGEQLHVERAFKKTNIQPKNYVTDVYVDNGVATARCISPNPKICVEDVPTPTKMSDWVPKLPHEWIAEAETISVITSQMVEGKRVILIRADTEKGRATILVDKFSGLPLRVELSSGIIYKFDGLSVNSVNLEEVTPPQPTVI